MLAQGMPHIHHRAPFHVRIHPARPHLPERVEDFEQLFRAYVSPSRAEPGCIEYHMLRDASDPTLLIFFEVWQSREHLAVHTALAHRRDFHERRMDYLSRYFEIREIPMLSPSSAFLSPGR